MDILKERTSRNSSRVWSRLNDSNLQERGSVSHRGSLTSQRRFNDGLPLHTDRYTPQPNEYTPQTNLYTLPLHGLISQTGGFNDDIFSGQDGPASKRLVRQDSGIGSICDTNLGKSYRFKQADDDSESSLTGSSSR